MFRRDVLAGSAGIAALGAVSYYLYTRHRLKITLINQDREETVVAVTVRAGDDIQFAETYDLAPSTITEEYAQLAGLGQGPYIVEAQEHPDESWGRTERLEIDPDKPLEVSVSRARFHYRVRQKMGEDMTGSVTA